MGRIVGNRISKVAFSPSEFYIGRNRRGTITSVPTVEVGRRDERVEAEEINWREPDEKEVLEADIRWKLDRSFVESGETRARVPFRPSNRFWFHDPRHLRPSVTDGPTTLHRFKGSLVPFQRPAAFTEKAQGQRPDGPPTRMRNPLRRRMRGHAHGPAGPHGARVRWVSQVRTIRNETTGRTDRLLRLDFSCSNR